MNFKSLFLIILGAFAATSAFCQGETLYNGVEIPSLWPPRDMQPLNYDPMPLPYLSAYSTSLPINVGRQLFVDDFLIEYTDMIRKFHNPHKYEGNPILYPLTEQEMQQDAGHCPMAAPFSDGVFYDDIDNKFKMWYMSGWFDGTSLAVSDDGIHWERPELDVVPGSNLVIDVDKTFGSEKRRDGASVWIDHDAKSPNERYKMYWWGRDGEVGDELKGGQGYLLTSADGVHWSLRGKTGESNDNGTLFYNPFRQKWIFNFRVKAHRRPTPPWSAPYKEANRTRSYWECSDFLEAEGGWSDFDPVFWFGADRLDEKRKDYPQGNWPQIYKVDCVAYESLMLGFINVHYGPENTACASQGVPKLTELELAYSRDGFSWDRTNRNTFISATLEEESWERGYVHSVGGSVLIVDDKLYIYYTAFKGDPANANNNKRWSGLYANASTGLAILRRDGFASMESQAKESTLLTKRLNFDGEYLFINCDSSQGEIKVEICNSAGVAIKGFTKDDCIAISHDTTKRQVRWKNDISSLKRFENKDIRLRFYATNSSLYSFWVSPSTEGESRGAIAAGGIGLNGYWDN